MVTRIVLLAGALVVIGVAGFFYISRYVLAGPSPSVGNTVSQSGGPTTSIHFEVVGAVGGALNNPRPNDQHPDWVGYLPSTILKVPANSTVNVTIDQEDSATPLRNAFWGKVQGTATGKMHVKYFDDKGNAQEGDFSAIDPATTAHTFAIPDLGVYVPLLSLNTNAPAGSKNVETFSFQTHGPGVFHWQCFVPCGAGTLFGNGGPMQTFGYMAGTVIVE